MVRRRQIGTKIVGVGLCGVLWGCGLWMAPAPPRRSAIDRDAPPPTAAPRLLSAQVAELGSATASGPDTLVLVFDAQVDAASLDPRVFVVSRASARPVRPTRARLGPANEDDENRTVWLEGEFGDPGPDEQPTHVAVFGPLYTEQGRSLTGQGATITPLEVGPSVVAAELLAAGPGRCEGSVTALRTYWSEALRGVEPEDLASIGVSGLSPKPAPPSGFDDHAARFAEAGQDNVLDLCLVSASASAATSVQVTVAAGLFHDVAGHPSAEVRLDVGVARAEAADSPAS